MSNGLNVILLVMSSNMDDFGFGLAIGFKEPVKWWVAAIIGLMSGVTMGAGILVGTSTTQILSTAAEQAFSAAIYIVLTVWFAIEELQSDPTNGKNAAHETATRPWTPFSALIMGIALGIDSFFLGISAGLQQMSFWFTGALAGISSFLLIFGGAILARKIAQRMPHLPYGLISAGILLLLAIMTLIKIEH